MKAEDFNPGARAKRHLRVAQALALLSKNRAPSLGRVRDAISRVQGNQPAVAMAIILEYSKRHPLHDRGEWLKAAGEALQEYRLSDDADQKEAELARDYIEHELTLYKAEIARIEKMRERFSLAILFLLVALMISAIVTFGYMFVQGLNNPNKDQEKPAIEKPAAEKKEAEKPPEKKPEEKHGAEKASKAEPKKADKEKKLATPPGK